MQIRPITAVQIDERLIRPETGSNSRPKKENTESGDQDQPAHPHQSRCAAAAPLCHVWPSSPHGALQQLQSAVRDQQTDQPEHSPRPRITHWALARPPCHKLTRHPEVRRPRQETQSPRQKHEYPDEGENDAHAAIALRARRLLRLDFRDGHETAQPLTDHPASWRACAPRRSSTRRRPRSADRYTQIVATIEKNGSLRFHGIMLIMANSEQSPGSSRITPITTMAICPHV